MTSAITIAPSRAVRWMFANPWWALGVLTLMRTVSVIDQGGITVLVAPIRADLGISDVQVSLLMGINITLVTCSCVIPVGFLVDWMNRRKLIAWSVVAWSSMSGLTGFAGSFWSLFLARSGLAAAEAVLPTAAQSIIRDSFPPERRGIPFSIYAAGAGLGRMLSLLVAGTLISLGSRGFFDHWPVIGHFKTWQLVLAFPGLCTFPLALLLLTMREPPRRVSQVLQVAQPTNRDVVRYVWQHRWVYVPFFLGQITYDYSSGMNAWMPTALIRGWGLSAAEIAHVLGTIGVPAVIVGLMLSGFLMDRLSRRGIGNGPMRVELFGSAIGAVCNISVLHVHAPWLIYTLLGLGQLFNAPVIAASVATLAYITPSRFFGRLTALMFLCLNLLANAIAPTLVPLVAKLFPGPLALVTGLNGFVAVEVTVSILCMLWATVRVERFGKLYPGGAG